MSDANEYPDLFRGAREYVLSTLPETVRNLHSRIEDYAKSPVDFRPHSMLRKIGINPATSDATYCDEFRSYVTVDDTVEISGEAIAHELLHIHRYWVEQAPQVEAIHDTGNAVEFMSWLDNALEHIIIVPRERDMGFNPTPYWAKQMINLYAHPSPTASLPQLRNGFLIGWTMSHFCKDIAAKKAALAQLHRTGTMREAKALLEGVVAALNDRNKELAVRKCLEAMRIAPTNVALVTLDIRNRSRSTKHLS